MDYVVLKRNVFRQLKAPPQPMIEHTPKLSHTPSLTQQLELEHEEKNVKSNEAENQKLSF